MRKKTGIILLATMLAMVSSSPYMAASNKKVQKAYAKYLERHVYEGKYNVPNYWRASSVVGSMDQVNNFVLCDLDKDKTPELITVGSVNFKNAEVRVFTYKKGKVKAYKMANGKSVRLSLRSTAAGRYYYHLCSKRHIHTVWTGWGFSTENVYKIKSKKLQEYMTSDLLSLNGPVAHYKGKKRITQNKFDSLTRNCHELTMNSYSNTASVRELLRKGKCKVIK